MVRLLIALALLTAACSTVDSNDLRTSGITSHIVVSTDGSGSTVTVEMGAGSLTSVELHNADRLVARSGDSEATFDQDDFLGRHTYTAHLVGVERPGTAVEVSLERGPDDTSVTSTVVVAPQLRVTGPTETTNVPRSQDLLLQTNHADGRIRVAWEGSCVVPGDQEYAADGALVVPAGALVRPEPVAGATTAPVPAACLVTLTISRIIDGTLGEGYDGGSIVAQRRLTRVIRSAP